VQAAQYPRLLHLPVGVRHVGHLGVDHHVGGHIVLRLGFVVQLVFVEFGRRLVVVVRWRGRVETAKVPPGGWRDLQTFRMRREVLPRYARSE
jgi:hypothetical protein